MRFYIVLTIIFAVQICACSTMNKKIQKSTNAVVKKESKKLDSTFINKLDSLGISIGQMTNVTHAIAENNSVINENIIEWIVNTPATAMDSASWLRIQGSPVLLPMTIRKTTRTIIDNGVTSLASINESSRKDSVFKTEKSAVSLQTVENSDSTAVREEFAKDLKRKRFQWWWIIPVLVLIAYLTRKKWLPEIARLFVS